AFLCQIHLAEIPSDCELNGLPSSGMLYFFALALIGYTTNRIMGSMATNKMYKIKDIEVAKNIK
ncbi:MAG: DUF1963 domain-containing protein, partial [Parcubacteria group bacterium]|nr:DUF1963 domain-containing protein [Parcubacteria group bacterium]